MPFSKKFATILNDFNIYREILVDWNQKMNLTGIEDEKEVYIKHFLDSVSAVTNGYIKDGVSIIDVGTGAGFPGIPLSIMNPTLKITLVDSLNKRLIFLQEVINKLGLKDKRIGVIGEFISYKMLDLININYNKFNFTKKTF